MWAFLDADLASRVVRRDGPGGGGARRLPGLDRRRLTAVQALERVAFGDVGWGWLDWSAIWHRRPLGPGHAHGTFAGGRGPHLDGRGHRPLGPGPRLRQAPPRRPARPAPNPFSAP